MNALPFGVPVGLIKLTVSLTTLAPLFLTSVSKSSPWLTAILDNLSKDSLAALEAAFLTSLLGSFNNPDCSNCLFSFRNPIVGSLCNASSIIIDTSFPSIEAFTFWYQ